MGRENVRWHGTDSYVDQYICKISFDSIQNARAAHCDVQTYGADYGYGHPYDCIDDSNHEEYWDVYMQCPDLPLVIRMANNHGGRIVWWNSQILQEPKVNIPFYIPPNPKKKKDATWPLQYTGHMIVLKFGLFAVFVIIQCLLFGTVDFL